MKNTLLPALGLAALVGLGAGSSLAPAQDAQEKTLKERVEALELSLDQARSQLDQMAAERATQAEALSELQANLSSQGVQAKAALNALDEAEEAGFLAGINPDSRKYLLKGLRDFLGEAAKSAPQSKDAAIQKGR
jgi:chromosome segregation ATPase